METTSPVATALAIEERAVLIAVGNARMPGRLLVPARPLAVVLFANVSGSTGPSPPDLFVSRSLGREGFASLLVNLLTAGEAAADAHTGWIRRETAVLADRVRAARRALASFPETGVLPVGAFACNDAAAATLAACADEPGIGAIVCCPGQARLDAAAVERVYAPTLVVAGVEPAALDAAWAVLAELRCAKDLTVVPGATHRFEERGALEAVAALAASWFGKHLGGQWRT